MTKKKNPEDLLKQGRKERIGEEEKKLIRQAIGMGCKNTEALAFANIKGSPICESVFYRYLERHPDFAMELSYLRKNPILKAKGTIFNNLNDPKVAQWYLEKRAGDEFSNMQKIDLSGSIENKIVTDDDIKELITGIIEINKINGETTTPDELLAQIKSIENQDTDNQTTQE